MFYQYAIAMCPYIGVYMLIMVGGLQVLHDFCSEILASKPTSIEADLQLLEALNSSAGSGDRQRLALQFRIGKKALLKSCIWQYDPAQLAV